MVSILLSIQNMDMSPLYISLKASLFATAASFVIGIIAARICLSLPKKLAYVFDGLFTMPMVLPPTVVGFFLLLLLGARSPIGQYLTSIGHRIVFSFSATVITAFVVSFPLMYRTVLGAFEQVDRNLIFAARTLGHGEASIFLRVYVPLAWPGIAAGTVLSFTRALGEFGATRMLAGNLPGRTQTMSLAIFDFVAAGNYDGALVWVVIIVCISFVSIFAVNMFSASYMKYQKRGR